jgi:dihydropteroate synthase
MLWTVPSAGWDSRLPPAFNLGATVMGVINVTPDSFSGDGLAGQIERVVALAEKMVEEGARILDIGGESTRPGFTPVSAEEEIRRVLPAVEAIRSRVRVPISVDTTKVVVATRVLGAGADMINDVSGIHNPEMTKTVARAGASLVLVHNGTVDRREALVESIVDDLAARVHLTQAAGVPESAILIDPGLGMGKSWLDNFEIIRRLDRFHSIGSRLLVGPSRKGMIGKVLGTDPVDRLEGTLALVSLCIAKGADVVRVHDVKEMARAARMLGAVIQKAGN